MTLLKRESDCLQAQASAGSMLSNGMHVKAFVPVFVTVSTILALSAIVQHREVLRSWEERESSIADDR